MGKPEDSKCQRLFLISRETSEGYQTMSSGFGSHAEGYQTTASGQYSHASGRGSTATANASAAIGYNVVADQENGTVVGQWNLSGQTGALFAVGNGSDDEARSDAFQVLSNGDAVVSGALMVNGVDLGALVLDLQQQIVTLQQQVDALGGGN